MNLENYYTIYKDDYGKYKIGLWHKNTSGKVEYAYYPVKFKKSIELDNKTKIYIKKWWLDFYNWEYNNKKGTTFYIFINEFTTVEQTIEQTKEEVKQANDPFEEFSNEADLSGLELPF